MSAKDGFQLWSESYDREFADIFAVQDEIADSVTRRFQLELGTPAGVARAEIDAATYDLFLRGRYLFDRNLFEQAQSMFERVLEQEPEFVPAMAWLARVYSESAIFNQAPPGEMFPKALEIAERALELDADSVEAHTSAASVLFWMWDMKSSLAHLQRAIELGDSDPQPRIVHAFWLTANGRHGEAISKARKAVDLDRLSPETHVELAWQFQLAGRPEEAIDATGRALDLEPDHQHALRTQALALQAQSRHEEALARHERVQDLDPDNIWNLASMARLQFRMGQSEAARATLQHLEKLAERGWVPPAAFLVASEDVETRLDWLERSFEARDYWLLMLEMDPFFDDLRHQPRFQTVVEEVRAATKR